MPRPTLKSSTKSRKPATAEAVRIQKKLAELGLGSRREIEGWIEEGRIQVNGEVASLGDKITDRCRVYVDGKRVSLQLNKSALPRVLLYNKPEGEVCTSNDPDGRKTVFDSIPKLNKSRWVMVGRLDLNTQGLLLFTDDGELAKRLMHPSYEIQREYAVRVVGEVDKAMLKRLCDGVQLDDGFARFEVIEHSGGEGANMWFHVIIKEGRNREVRRLWESQGVKVSRLIRVRFGDVLLPRSLRRGKYADLDKKMVQKLMKAVDLPAS
jgi:23S rRNA pseudouridine2605 synthase